MACTWDPDLLQMYLDDALTPTERTLVAAHLRECPECRRESQRLKALFWELDHPEPLPLPDTALAAQAEALLAQCPPMRSSESGSKVAQLLPAWASQALAGAGWTATGPAQAFRSIPGLATRQPRPARAGRGSLTMAAGRGLKAVGRLASRLVRPDAGPGGQPVGRSGGRAGERSDGRAGERPGGRAGDRERR